MLHHLICFWW